VLNNGTIAQTEGAYCVKVMCGEEELGSAHGGTIQPGSSVYISVPVIFAQPGAMSLYAMTALTGDERPANDLSHPINITVLPSGGINNPWNNQALLRIRLPLDFYFRNSLYEVIYPAAYVSGNAGILESIQIFNHFQTNLPGMPVNIWMGNTAHPNLSAGWVPSTQLTQVFSGNVDFFAGVHTVTIPLSHPFVYTGGNLIMMFERVMDTQGYNSEDCFLGRYLSVNQALIASSSIVDFDPANPPENANPTGYIPRMLFNCINPVSGVLMGRVTHARNPLIGSQITVDGNVVASSTTLGQYAISSLGMGSHTITCQKTGYQTQSHEVIIVENQIATVNFQMLRPPVSITGRVVGSDNSTMGLPDVAITLSGAYNYTAITNAMGDFLLEVVQPFLTYTLTISRPGYVTRAEDVIVGSDNLNLGIIVLTEFIPPPSNVDAEFLPSPGKVLIRWNSSPDPNAQSYKVWRLWQFDENNPQNWALLTPTAVMDTLIWDASILGASLRAYRWAVCAVYPNNVLSPCAFSNHWEYNVPLGIISGRVHNVNSEPIAGAEVQAASVSAFTDLSGYYFMAVPIGVWAVACIKEGFQLVTTDNVIIYQGQTVPLNFNLDTVSNSDDNDVSATTLLSCHPNPFHHVTYITYQLKAAAKVRLEIYNAKGQRVKTLIYALAAKGRHSVGWDGTDEQGRPVGGGIFLYRMSAGGHTSTGKLLLTK